MTSVYFACKLALWPLIRRYFSNHFTFVLHENTVPQQEAVLMRAYMTFYWVIRKAAENDHQSTPFTIWCKVKQCYNLTLTFLMNNEKFGKTSWYKGFANYKSHLTWHTSFHIIYFLFVSNSPLAFRINIFLFCIISTLLCIIYSQIFV